MPTEYICNPHGHDSGQTSTALCSSHHFYATSEFAEVCQFCSWRRTRMEVRDGKG